MEIVDCIFKYFSLVYQSTLYNKELALKHFKYLKRKRCVSKALLVSGPLPAELCELGLIPRSCFCCDPPYPCAIMVLHSKSEEKMCLNYA